MIDHHLQFHKRWGLQRTDWTPPQHFQQWTETLTICRKVWRWSYLQRPEMNFNNVLVFDEQWSTSPMPRMASVAPLMRPTVVAMMSQGMFWVWSSGISEKMSPFFFKIKIFPVCPLHHMLAVVFSFQFSRLAKFTKQSLNWILIADIVSSIPSISSHHPNDQLSLFTPTCL